MNIRKMLVFIAIIGLSASVFAAPHHARRSRRVKAAQVQKVAGKVNINSAAVTALQAVKGIGPKKAETIVSYRRIHGSFKSINDLTNIKGIGAKRLTKISQYLTV